jgi:lipid II:glycine glycyltransferase (peptidoglycan interpeptide bridge formation enzyme)
MEIISFLTGKRAVSLPFTDESHPITQNADQFQSLLKNLKSYGTQAGWKHIEFRGENQFLNRFSTYTHHFTHTLALDEDEKKIFSSFKSNVKRNIKKAQKESLQIEISSSWNPMKVFCELNILTRKQHGLPPQPVFFFRNIFKHIISPGNGFVTLALWKDTPVAAAVFFHFGKKAIYKYGASDRNYQHLRANNLVMWEAISWCTANGFNSLSFGRTEPENHGLLQFKRGWGTREEKLNYYKYDLKKECFLSKKKGIKTSYNFFRLMPALLLRLAGNLLYRHVG